MNVLYYLSPFLTSLCTPVCGQIDSCQPCQPCHYLSNDLSEQVRAGLIRTNLNEHWLTWSYSSPVVTHLLYCPGAGSWSHLHIMTLSSCPSFYLLFLLLIDCLASKSAVKRHETVKKKKSYLRLATHIFLVGLLESSKIIFFLPMPGTKIFLTFMLLQALSCQEKARLSRFQYCRIYKLRAFT